MLKLLVTSEMASDDDKDLLDIAWRAGTAAANQQVAEEFLAEAAEFANQPHIDDSPETSENEETKEADNG
ncbi:hypothetical protein AB0N24_04530 [Arthrobacter sp. NPDC093128]|uniref:hypothetical protein n=1 Tax=Arthrobacter sp. NPDC093128 TaxID=3154979 RepID=UPI003430C463